MKKKLKLPLYELRQEVGEVISNEELKTILGGNYGLYEFWDTEDEFFNNLFGMVSAGMFEGLIGSGSSCEWDMGIGSGSGSGGMLIMSGFNTGSYASYFLSTLGSGSVWRPEILDFGSSGSSMGSIGGSSFNGWFIGSSTGAITYQGQNGTISFVSSFGGGWTPQIELKDTQGNKGYLKISASSGRITIGGSVNFDTIGDLLRSGINLFRQE